MSDSTHESDFQNPGPRPFWVPEGVDFDRLPQQLRTAIFDIVDPIYQSLVLEAQDALQKSAGLTVVSLAWLEILDQIRLGEELRDPDTAIQCSAEREKLIARHLRLAGAKIKAASFLLRIHEFRNKFGHLPGVWSGWTPDQAHPYEATPGGD